MASEVEIQKAVMEYIRSLGLTPHRINAGMFKGKYQTAPKGWPDIVVILPPGGRLLGLEVKAKLGKQRADQRDMQKLFESNGAMYAIVRCVDDVRGILEEMGNA